MAITKQQQVMLASYYMVCSAHPFRGMYMYMYMECVHVYYTCIWYVFACVAWGVVILVHPWAVMY